MKWQLTISYTPQKNGVFERKNQTVITMGKSMLHAVDLRKSFWAKTVYTAVYLINRCPTKVVCKQTPFEAWRGRNPQIRHLRVFGCICYAQIPKTNSYKLDEASEKFICVGYSTMLKGYRLFSLKTNKITLAEMWCSKKRLNEIGSKAKRKSNLFWLLFYSKMQLKKIKVILEALHHHHRHHHHHLQAQVYHYQTELQAQLQWDWEIWKLFMQHVIFALWSQRILKKQ